MYHAGTVFGGYEITGNHPEGVTVVRLGVRQQLLIADPFQFCTLELFNDLAGDIFLAFFVVAELKVFVLFREVIAEQVFGKHQRYGEVSIWVEGLHCNIVDLFADSQCCVGWERPRGGRPCQEEHVAMGFIEKEFRLIVPHHPELCRYGKVLYVLITTRHVQFV